jgi:hypothetical protein
MGFVPVVLFAAAAAAAGEEEEEEEEEKEVDMECNMAAPNSETGSDA